MTCSDQMVTHTGAYIRAAINCHHVHLSLHELLDVCCLEESEENSVSLRETMEITWRRLMLLYVFLC